MTELINKDEVDMQMMWGRKITKIDRFFPSSKTCSNCGTVKKDLDLKTRVFECDTCDSILDRDLNASINIKRVGASALAGEVVRATSVA